MPGVDELALLGGHETVEENIKELFTRTPVALIVVKRGKQGAAVFSREHGATEVIYVPAYAVEEVDPTGAGDCFDAGFLCGLLEGLSLKGCAEVASAAGALNAGAFGPMEGKISRAHVAQVMKSGCVPLELLVRP
jgi:sugar/nucleoside kinase (ribokinase family)